MPDAGDKRQNEQKIFDMAHRSAPHSFIWGAPYLKRRCFGRLQPRFALLHQPVLHQRQLDPIARSGGLHGAGDVVNDLGDRVADFVRDLGVELAVGEQIKHTLFALWGSRSGRRHHSTLFLSRTAFNRSSVSGGSRRPKPYRLSITSQGCLRLM